MSEKVLRRINVFATDSKLIWSKEVELTSFKFYETSAQHLAFTGDRDGVVVVQIKASGGTIVISESESESDDDA